MPYPQNRLSHQQHFPVVGYGNLGRAAAIGAAAKQQNAGPFPSADSIFPILGIFKNPAQGRVPYSPLPLSNPRKVEGSFTMDAQSTPVQNPQDFHTGGSLTPEESALVVHRSNINWADADNPTRPVDAAASRLDVSKAGRSKNLPRQMHSQRELNAPRLAAMDAAEESLRKSRVVKGDQSDAPEPSARDIHRARFRAWLDYQREHNPKSLDTSKTEVVRKKRRYN